MNLQGYESKVDLEALEAFLESDKARPEWMDLSTLDGFLAGLAVGPEMIPPSEWLPVIWGCDLGGEEPSFEDANEAQLVLGMILERYGEIVATLELGLRDVVPIYETDEDDIEDPGFWVDGFMAAVHLRSEAWTSLFSSRKDAVLLFPILALATLEDGSPYLTGEELPDEMLAKIPSLIPVALAGIYDFWQERTHRTEPIRRVAEPGRNSGCPCGSGKKYKRCCGR